jgi:uncharacterized membrane protein
MKRIFSVATAVGLLLLSPTVASAMDRIIVATFSDSNSAYEVAKAVKDLTDLKVKTGTMIAKDQNGNVSVLESRSRPLFGTAVGTATGALIGLIGGAPGAAVGAALGATSGLGADAVTSMLDADFVNSVRAAMPPGTTAIIVEADESSTRAVDDIAGRYHGQVYRQTSR